MSASTNHPIPFKGGDEYGALTRAKKYYHWEAGERKAIKRGYQRRVRRMSRAEAHREAAECEA